jgi:iron complex transport system permease protein
VSLFMHAADAAQPQALRRLVVGLVLLTLLAMALSLSVGSQGWEPLLHQAQWPTAQEGEMSSLQVMAHQILWEIRLPRTLGTWLAGALLGLSGALAQGLFRNPLADPYLLGSSSGAALGVALCMAAFGLSPMGMAWWGRMGLTGAAFVGGLLAVLLTLLLARGVAHTLRLLLAGVVVGVVLGALSAMTMLLVPDIMRPMQAFMLGTTGFLGWPAVAVMAPALALTLCAALAGARALDALSLGDAVARSLGVPMAWVRAGLVLALALSTATAVAQAGLVSFVGLVAPHLVRARVVLTHGPLMALSAAMGGLLLLCADTLARWCWAPQELPVGVLTAVMGGGYLLWRMHRS